MIALLIGLLLPAVQKIREAAARTYSSNNLKEIGIAVDGMANTYNGLMPPSTGQFPARGPDSTIFFHMLPYIEQHNVYKTYMKDPTKVPDTLTIKQYCAPNDATNPGVGSALTSYASNAQIFGLDSAAPAKMPAIFALKGRSNTIIFMERYAKPDPKTSHAWYDTGATRTYVYPIAKGAIPWSSILDPQFDPSGHNAKIIDETAQSFSPKVLLVGVADLSVRAVSPTIVTTFKVKGVVPDPSAWQWACNVRGALAEELRPNGW